MQLTKKQATYNAAMYVRISKDDAEKSESYSVSNQRELILSFLKSCPDINLCSERVDDGYSGVSFDRPAMQELLGEIKNGTIDCIIVKDFSRFGRNYLEVGNFIEQIFPFLGVRFIYVNDNFDSNLNNGAAGAIDVAFKNLDLDPQWTLQAQGSIYNYGKIKFAFCVYVNDKATCF